MAQQCMTLVCIAGDQKSLCFEESRTTYAEGVAVVHKCCIAVVA